MTKYNHYLLRPLTAVRGQALTEGSVEPYALEDRLFDTTEHNAYDAENKLFEHIGHTYEATRQEVTGKILLFTERSPCDSCGTMSEQFGSAFPGIDVITEYYQYQEAVRYGGDTWIAGRLGSLK